MLIFTRYLFIYSLLIGRAFSIKKKLSKGFEALGQLVSV
jgi:hypothetical protein